jgi:hypothetical protein
MRYFFGFIAVIVLLILVSILVFKGFKGNGGPAAAQVNLLNYATTNTVMQLTIDGPITADQTHQGIRIDVGQYYNTMSVYQGYNNNVTSSQTFNNNPNSYAVFLRALDLLGFTKGNTNPALADSRGYCPTGERYIYEIQTNGVDSQKFWSATCNGEGNFSGDSVDIRNLFDAQIPDYATIANGTAL